MNNPLQPEDCMTKDDCVEKLQAEIAFQKSGYIRILKDMQKFIALELIGVDDGTFEPSSYLETTALSLIQKSNRLQSLIDVAKAHSA